MLQLLKSVLKNSMEDRNGTKETVHTSKSIRSPWNVYNNKVIDSTCPKVAVGRVQRLI